MLAGAAQKKAALQSKKAVAIVPPPAKKTIVLSKGKGKFGRKLTSGGCLLAASRKGWYLH